jgi:hypothetical protein
MNENDERLVAISIDMKKYRIRIHKSTLHLLGDPKYIQLLFNPDKMIVGLECLETHSPRDLAEQVFLGKIRPDCSFEMYSKSFVKNIQSVVGLEGSYSYRLVGHVIQSEHIAVFPMKTIQKSDL